MKSIFPFYFTVRLIAAGTLFWSFLESRPALAASDLVGTPNIVEVRVEGTLRVEPEAIRLAMTQKKGTPFDPRKTAEDLRAIWSLNYFADVTLSTEKKGDGLVYTVRVTEKPSVREVKIQGNEELSKDDLKDTLDIKSGTILDRDAIRRTVKKISEKYVEKGYFLAEVTDKVVPVFGSQAADIIFSVREHAKVMVKAIRFLGAQKVPAAELKEVMATKEGGYLSFLTGEGTYREEVFQRDLAIIQAAYYDRGFINVKVEKPWLSLSPDKRFIFITLKVEEGEQYRINKLDFSGELLISKQELHGKMSSHELEIFNRSKLAKDIQAITDVYYDQGYAYANVTPVTQVNPEARTIDLTFDIQKGKQVAIEKIEIVGNSKTRDQVIRREMRVYEGELFNGSGVKRSKQRITALGFFETVEVEHRPGSDDSKVAVVVTVKERNTGTFTLGVGYSSQENIVFNTQISQNNLLGWGQTASLSGQISSLRSLIQASYFDPYFLDSQLILSADYTRTLIDYPGYIRRSNGGDLSVGYHLLEDLMGTLTYNLESVTTESGSTYYNTGSFGGYSPFNPTSRILLANLFRNGLASSLRLSMTFDRRDNRLFPSKGFFFSGSAEVAPKFLGGSFLFARYTGNARFYFPLPLGMVFKTNTTLGYIQSLDSSANLPISELYYLGGINTVRGYFLRSITPTLLVGSSSKPDALVQAFGAGGNKQAVFNFELEFPIFEKVGIKGVLFYDLGNVYSESESFFDDRQNHLFLGMFHSVGAGIRWFSPIGPLRFEWGFPLNRRARIDQASLFEFTIGNSF